VALKMANLCELLIGDDIAVRTSLYLCTIISVCSVATQSTRGHDQIVAQNKQNSWLKATGQKRIEKLC